MRRIDVARIAATVSALSVLSALALLAGCSGSAADPDTDPTPGGRPLDAYLNPPVDEEKSKADQEKIQEAVARCMKDQGFDYTPSETVDPVEPPEVDLTDRSWVEKYGYGITTRDEEPIELPEDENSERLNKMTEKQREAYLKALHGTGGIVIQGGNAVPARPGGDDGGDDGCYGKAQREVFPDSKPIDFEEFADLFDAIAKIDEQVQQDSRIVPLIKEWAGCLAGAGYGGFSKINEPEESIRKKWADLNGWEYSAEGGGRATTMGKSEETEPPDPLQVAELRAEELKLALADVDCRGDHTATVNQVRIELERRFIEEHREELERYRDLINQGR